MMHTVLAFFGILAFSTLSYVSDPNRQEKEIMQKMFAFLFFLSPVLALVVFCNRRSPTPLSKAATALAFVFLGAFVVALLAFVGIYDMWWGASCYVMHSEGLGGLGIRPVSSACTNWSDCGSTCCTPTYHPC